MIKFESSNAVTTLVIVSSDYLVRCGLQAVIHPRPHLRLIGEVASAMEAEDMVIRKRPHVLIIHMGPEVDTLNLVRRIKASVPTTKIIVLTDLEDKRRTREVLSAGIDGIVLNSQPPAAMLATIDYVAHCLVAEADPRYEMGRPDVNALADPIDGTEPTSTKCPDLVTKREREIVALIGEGLSNKDIAGRLGITSITVRHHLTSIFDKLGVATRQKLLIRAHQYKLVAPSAFASSISGDR
ncbi:MAG: LuxR C-terminal-related transcriptional regulator [Nitrospira sp.]